jgi:hypothetical protein
LRASSEGQEGIPREKEKVSEWLDAFFCSIQPPIMLCAQKPFRKHANNAMNILSFFSSWADSEHRGLQSIWKVG